MVQINGSQHIIFSEALVLQRQGLFDLQSLDQNSYELSVYPPLLGTPELSHGKIFKIKKAGSIMSTFQIELPLHRITPKVKTIQQNKIQVTFPEGKPAGINDLFLIIDYIGDTGMGFLNGELVADDFYNGTKWSIGLKKFMDRTGKNEMIFYFRPMYKDAPYFDDFKTAGIPIPQDARQKIVINSVKILPEYQTTVSFAE